MVMNYEWERPGGMMNVPPLTEPRWIGKGIGRGAIAPRRAGMV